MFPSWIRSCSFCSSWSVFRCACSRLRSAPSKEVSPQRLCFLGSTVESASLCRTQASPTVSKTCWSLYSSLGLKRRTCLRRSPVFACKCFRIAEKPLFALGWSWWRRFRSTACIPKAHIFVSQVEVKLTTAASSSGPRQDPECTLKRSW